MENELALIPEFHAVAVNATEMQQANQGIRKWLEAKVASLKDVVSQSYSALDAATRNGWKTDALRGVYQREKQRERYYGKLLAAVEAGYTIVPNMDVDVIAIRVKREKPAEASQTDISRYGYSTPRIENEKEQRLEIGEGRYESPVQMVRTAKHKGKNEKGDDEYTTTVTPTGFADIEFPMAVAHPVVMDATARAMSIKLFDRIGVVPASVTRGDPIVLGQVTMKQGWATRTASFLIAWYLDPRTL